MKVVLSIVFLLCISNPAFSDDTLQGVANAIFAEYGHGYTDREFTFWVLKEYVIRMNSSSDGTINYFAIIRHDKKQMTLDEISYFLRNKGTFALTSTAMDADEYRSPGLVACYDHIECLLFIVDEKRYSKQQNNL